MNSDKKQMGKGVGIGLAIGVALSVALGNWAFMALGLALGAGYSIPNSKKEGDSTS